MKEDTDSKFNIIKATMKIIFKILYNIIIIICVLLILVIVLQKVTDSNKSIAGYRIFRVVTGSMIPQYDIGEVVICKETEGKDIKIGDDIVYLGAHGEYSGKIIMHEVVDIDIDENNNLNFHAKGLNNSLEDPEIKEQQIFGVVKFKSKILTVLYKLATSIYSSFIIITVLVLNVFISFKFSGKEEVQQIAEANYKKEDGEEKKKNRSKIEKNDEDIDKEDVQENIKNKKSKKKKEQDKQNKKSDEA